MPYYLRVVILLTFLFPTATNGFQNKAEIAANQNQRDRAQFRILRSICGGKGSLRGDRFVMEDPRTVFYVPEDRQVTIYMEMEGPVGEHHIEGFWKSPVGKIASLSDFTYTSQQKSFSTNLTLAILESAATGTWTLEVHIDGEYLSEVNFQIVAGIRPASPVPTRKLLSPSELYQRALASTVTIERFGQKGDLLGTSAGFVADQSLLISAFAAIDGASRLRLKFPNGMQKETDQILACNRRQGYSVISVDASQTPALPIAPESSWQIGDSVIFLEVASDGNWVLSEAKIVGKSSSHQIGDRMNLSTPASVKSVGGALLNEYGEIIGLICGPLYSEAGAYSVDSRSGATAAPIGVVDYKRKDPRTLDSLAQNGELLLPVNNQIPILYAQLTHKIEKGGNRQWPIDSSNRFSRGDGKISIFVMWNPKDKLKGTLNFQVYDLGNKLLGPSGHPKDAKVNFKPGRQISSSWELDVSRVPPGTYRIDVQFNGVACWRTFFQITE